MGARPPALASIAAAVVFALSCFCFTLFVWISFGGEVPFGAKGYRVHALFGADAVQLTSNAQVRISGVPVGRVVSVDRRGLDMDATIELEPEYAPLPRDARATLRVKTLLGETFVELTPGTRGGPVLAEGATLPRSGVRPVESLDEVLSAFDEDAREAFKDFLADVGDALDERGGDLNATLGNAAPASRELAEIVAILDEQRPAVQRLIRDGGTALEAVSRRDADLRRLIAGGDAVFGATARRNRELTATVRALPRFLGDLRGTLAELDGATADAAPALRTLRPVAPLLRPALEEGSRLAPDLRGAFGELGPVLDASERGLPALTRLVDTLGPVLGTLHTAGRDLVPVVDLLGAYRREAVATLSNFATTTQASTKRADGSRLHYLRILAPFSNEGPFGWARRHGTNRHNPYLRPGGLEDLGRGGLRSLSCANASNPTPMPPLGSGAPPCLAQEPWEFRGKRRSYPHLEPDAP